MSRKLLGLFALVLVAAAVVMVDDTAEAGLCDWLCGRHHRDVCEPVCAPVFHDVCAPMCHVPQHHAPAWHAAPAAVSCCAPAPTCCAPAPTCCQPAAPWSH